MYNYLIVHTICILKILAKEEDTILATIIISKDTIWATIFDIEGY